MIHDLKRQGLSVSAIARQTGLDRKTVRKYLDRGLEVPVYGPRDPRPRLLEPYEGCLSEKIRKCPGLSGRRLHREITVLGYTGGYSAVTDYLRSIRSELPRVFERRFETELGEQAQVDFAACGGATGEVLYDRMKTAVLGEDADGTVVYNSSLVAMLDHYGSAPKACKAYRAKTKGKVERPFRYIGQDFFLGRIFRNMDDLNVQFDQWRAEITNPRVHATTNKVVNEAFDAELPFLIPLPTHPYDAVLTVKRRVSHKGMVSMGGNLYSVPDTARKRVLEVQSHPSEIRIFEEGTLIARHSVLAGRNQRRVDPSHRKAPPPIRNLGHLAEQQTSRHAGGVGQRSLAFYDAVARRLATQEVRR